MEYSMNPDMPRLDEEVAIMIDETATMMGINLQSELGQRIHDFRSPEDQITWKAYMPEGVYDGTRTIHNTRYDENGLWLPSRGGFRIAWLGNTGVYGEHGTNSGALSGFLAAEMGLKLLPYESGGAKAVIDAQDPELVGDKVFMEELCRKTVRALFRAGHYRKYRNAEGMPTDIWAPDLNTGKYIDAMVDELTFLTGDARFARTAFTGKSPENGGHPERIPATGRGAAFLLARTVEMHPVLKQRFAGRDSLRVSQQSLGQVGWHLQDTLPEYLEQRPIVTAVSEFDGTLIDTTGDGLPIHVIKRGHIASERVPLKDWQQRGIQWTENPGAILEVPTDILSLSYDKNQVTADNADLIDAAYVHPSSNGGVNPNAKPKLFRRGTVVGGDFVVNGAGARGSEMETASSWSGQQIPVRQFRQALEASMAKTLDGTFSAMERWSGHESPSHPLMYDLGMAATAAALEYLVNEPLKPTNR